MRRHIKYIILSLITFFAAVSCIEEMESPHVSGREQLTLVPRVTSFTNQYVTKAAYDSGEDDINRLAVLVFNNQGILVHFQESTSTATVTLNRSMFNHSGMTKSTIVMIANMDLSNITKGTAILSTTAANKTVTLSDMEDYVFDFGSNVFYTSVPDSGFPMIGGVSGVDFTEGNDEIAVNLKVLFAKVSLEIAVENGTENTLNTTQFTISNATITNLAKATPLAIPAEVDAKPKDFLGNVKEDEDPSTSAGFTKTEFVDISSENKVRTITSTEKTVSAGSTSAKYTFYIAENRYNHAGAEGIYPDILWNNSDLYDNYKQQYKPKLASKQGGKGVPTYITLTGTYTDYRSTQWAVNYTVYLGKNNYDDFHIDRNSEYTNKITIKGLRNNNSYKEYDDEGNLVDQHVWIDHRVNVSTTDISKHVTITRETLIDAHIEVRPLRINLAGSNYQRAAIYLPKYPDGNAWKQLDEIMGGANENWIAIENNNGSTNKGTLYSSNGKRRYFTTSLIEELHSQSASINIDSDGNKYINLVDGDCAWLYFDENASSATRRARIDVVFYPSSGSAVTESYYVYQSGYAESGGQKFENYEEYLHSYDSSDNYGLTTSPTDYTQKGLEWGYKGTVFSKNNIVSQVDIGWVLGNTTANLPYIQDLRYDYFCGTDLSSNSMGYIYSANTSWNALTDVQKQNETGLYFTDRATQNAPTPITIMDLNMRPSSAYQYCLSKNKFKEDADGNHTLDIHWYLPDVNELESVFKANHADADLYADAYYWSSQPSYTDLLGGTILDAIESVLGDTKIIDEDANNARAVSKTSTDNISRDQQHRIRCFYSSTGIDGVNMKDRVPSGLGGIIKIPMTVRDNGFFNSEAWLKSLEKDITQYPNPTPTYNFPEGKTYATGNSKRDDADDDFSGKEEDGTHYYNLNPLDSKNWGQISASGKTYYRTIHESKWPGLTQYDVKNVELLGYSAICELTNEKKKIVRSEIVRTGFKIESMPDVSGVFLDHNEGDGKTLKISFSKGQNDENHSPKYEYYNETSTTITEWAKEWYTPTYTADPNNGKEETFKGSDRSLETTAEAERLLKHEQLERSGYEITSSKTVRTGNKWYNYKYHYEIVASINKYYYASPGGWGTEKKTKDGVATSPKKSNVDALTIYGGNTFTITAEKGYRIRSIKVNFSDDNGVKNVTGDLVDISYRNLRLVDGRQTLPTTAAPDYMSYSGDGQAGWFQWTAPTVDEYASSVTLKLVAYVPADGTNVLRPTSFQYANPTQANLYQSDLETSIVIDSFEIRVEEDKSSTTD